MFKSYHCRNDVEIHSKIHADVSALTQFKYLISLNSIQYLHYLRPAFTHRRAQLFKPIANVAAVTVSGATSKQPPKVSVPRVM